MALQVLVSRDVSPFEPVVVTVGEFHGGEARNVMAGHATLTGTVRTWSEQMRAEVPDRLERIVSRSAHALGAKATFAFESGNAGLANDPACAEVARQAVLDTLGAEGVADYRGTLSGEDFSEYLRLVPGVFCFVGTDREIDTRPILEDILSAGKALCVPLCTAPGIMEPRQVTDLGQLSPGTFGVLEPPAGAPAVPVDAIDFAVLPCVTCNYQGHRLGHGGGYYDRFLSQFRGGTVLLCREQLIRQEIPVEPHDYPVPWVLTERGLYEDGIPAPLG